MRTKLAAVAFALGFVTARTAHGQTVANVANQHACDTSGVQGLSNQLVTVQFCMHPGQFVSFAPHAGVNLTSARIHAYLVSQSRDAVWAAAGNLALDVTSAFRTLADQYVLYYSGACALAATPGNSNHETGRAVDLSNWSQAVTAMTNAGCTHTYPSSDPVHFDCPGADLRADSISAFQHLWNVNNPGDQIAEDGAYGPMTEARLARSPAGGFANPADCSGPPPPPDWAGTFVAQSFPGASVGALTMHPGQSVAAWIDMRNTGRLAWNAQTHLATTQPRDRASPFVAADWVSPNRLAAVTGTVAPGATHRFAFTFHAPNATGAHDEHFGMVQEGVAWFSDPMQGGPPDNELEVRIDVVPQPPTDSGQPQVDAAADTAIDNGTDVAITESGDVATDAPRAMDAPANTDVSASGDSIAANDAGGESTSSAPGGCRCAVAGGGSARVPTRALLALGIALVLSVRRRRRAR